MSTLNFKLTLSEELINTFSPRRLTIIEAIAQGLSNKAIAEEYNISVKSVEQSITSINKILHANQGSYNSRVRILCALLSKKLLNFSSEIELSKVYLKEVLNQTLILACIGLSNKIIAELLSCSEKNIEQRLGQLFDYFGIETKNLEIENPRTLLFVHAYLHGNVNIEQIRRLYDKTSTDKLNRILKDTSLFINTLNHKHHFIG